MTSRDEKVRGCGDNSCMFGPPDGMAANGGCRCLKNGDQATRMRVELSVRTLRAQLAEAQKRIAELEAADTVPRSRYDACNADWLAARREAQDLRKALASEVAETEAERRSHLESRRELSEVSAKLRTAQQMRDSALKDRDNDYFLARRYMKERDEERSKVMKLEQLIIELAQKGNEWQNYAENMERKADVTMAEELQRLRAAERERDNANAEIARLKEALELIAAPKRADGTYNRGREACEQIAKTVLASQPESKVHSTHAYWCVGPADHDGPCRQEPPAPAPVEEKCEHEWKIDGQHSNEYCGKCFVSKPRDKR